MNKLISLDTRSATNYQIDAARDLIERCLNTLSLDGNDQELLAIMLWQIDYERCVKRYDIQHCDEILDVLIHREVELNG